MDRDPAIIRDALFALGQLRHLYAQMLDGRVKDTAEAARGLLGPNIERLERFVEGCHDVEAR